MFNDIKYVYVDKGVDFVHMHALHAHIHTYVHLYMHTYLQKQAHVCMVK